MEVLLNRQVQFQAPQVSAAVGQRGHSFGVKPRGPYTALTMFRAPQHRDFKPKALT